MAVEVLAMKQSTPEWLELRAAGGADGSPMIGSSDLPVILGVSPWKTPYQLWREKTGKQEPAAPAPWMLAGNDREPIARMLYELRIEKMAQGLTFAPAVLADRERGWVASLDGRCTVLGHKVFHVELKAPGIKDHEKAQAHRIPAKYVPQLAWQLWLEKEFGTVDPSSDYVSLSPLGESIEVVPFGVDAALELYWEIQMLPAVAQFQEWVKTDTEPPLDDKDRVLVEDIALELSAAQLRSLNERIVPLQEEYKRLEEDLKAKALAIHPRTIINDVLITRYSRGGGKDWEGGYRAAVAKVKELADILGEPVDVPTVPEKGKTFATKVTVRG